MKKSITYFVLVIVFMLITIKISNGVPKNPDQAVLSYEQCWYFDSEGRCLCKQGTTPYACVATCAAWVYVCKEIIIE